jgi:hypothetical protein
MNKRFTTEHHKLPSQLHASICGAHSVRYSHASTEDMHSAGLNRG